jgi:hypothetical protein
MARRALPVGAALLIAGVAIAASTDLALLARRPDRPVRASGPVATSPAPRSALPAAAAEDLALPHPVAAATRVGAALTGRRAGLATDSVAIPRQRVAAPVDLCAMSDGELEPPADVSRTCRWAGGADLDDPQGTVAITGHINWVGQGTGALGRLGQLHPGDTVLTSDDAGRVTRWRVRSVEFRNKNRGVDLDAFTGPAGPRTLYLISCGGPFDAASASYIDNIYVRATPIAVA